MGTVVIKIGLPSGGNYPVHIYTDDGAEDWLRNPRGYSDLPMTLIPGGDPAATCEADARRILRRGDGELEELEQVGQYLYRLLFRDEILEAWAQAQHCPCQPGQRASLTVLDIEPPELRSLPWELLTTTDEERRRLFLDPGRPFVRGRIEEGSSDAPPHEWPLRALIVVGASPDDEVVKHEEAREEVTTILRALREIGRTAEAEVLWRPSKKALLQSYTNFRPHIFHFIGHGGPPATDEQLTGAEQQPNRRPYLKLYDQEKAEPWVWTVDDIQADLKGKHPASLAIINACRTDEAIAPGDTLSIARAFSITGIPAVVGMLGNVLDEVAQEFAAGFYRALGAGKPVDVALSLARQSVNESRSDFGVAFRHWALPSLTLTAHPDAILAVRPLLEPTRLQQFREDDTLRELSSFVDRQDQRRSLIHIDPYHEPAANKSLLLVRGESGVGKTALVQLFLECCAMRGRKILWVNMRGRTMSFIQALCAISAGDPDSRTLLGKPLEPQEVFNQFHFELPYLLGNQEPPEMPLGRAYGPPPLEEQILSGTDAGYLNRIVNRFNQSLVKMAGGRPLIIALDHLTFHEYEYKNYVFPRLIRPIKEHKLAPVRMIMVLSKSNGEQYNLDDRDSPFYIGDTVPLPKFVSDDFECLAYEFFRYNNLPRDEARKAIQSIVSSHKWAQREWTPYQLVTVWRGMRQETA